MFRGAQRPLARAALFACAFLLLKGCSQSTSQGTVHEAAAAATPIAKSTYQAPAAPPPLPQFPIAPPRKTMPVLAGDAVIQQYKNQSQTLTQPDWENLGKYICKDLAARGTGLYTTKAAASAPVEVQHNLMEFARDAAVVSYCPGTKEPPAPWGPTFSGFDQAILVATRLDMYRQEDEYNTLIGKYMLDLVDYGKRYNVDVSLLLLNANKALSAGTSSTVTCKDEWVSSSGESSAPVRITEESANDGRALATSP